MSQAPSMPMYWKAYLADTTHLTTEEHGAYMLLMATMWQRNGFVSDNDEDNARALGLTLGKWGKVKSRLSKFLVFNDGYIGSNYINAIVIWEKMSHKRPSIPSEIRDLVFRRDGKVCRYCGATGCVFHLDHILPWSRGGDHSAANLAVACADCNRRKSDKTPEEMGWTL